MYIRIYRRVCVFMYVYIYVCTYVCVYIHKNIYFVRDFQKHIFDFIKYQQYLFIFPQGGQKLFPPKLGTRPEQNMWTAALAQREAFLPLSTGGGNEQKSLFTTKDQITAH